MKSLGELAITALAGFWQNILLPAITTVYDFFNASILPIIQNIATFISDTFWTGFRNTKRYIYISWNCYQWDC